MKIVYVMNDCNYAKEFGQLHGAIISYEFKPTVQARSFPGYTCNCQKQSLCVQMKTDMLELCVSTERGTPTFWD